ncbi:hypothetical protein EK21DRAFT_118552 [Setomelanomma holmii]|uniref:Uncharacterized protein n=1 Tax=Setomelanomma holmii TaxID=210430 RepID=A0A9P4LET2_9PLEO|nr:hypothetical protein EK21DRAFT_118552 [Setomelanomma holmii]
MLRKRIAQLTVLSILAILILSYLLTDTSLLPQEPNGAIVPANSTLGYGTILAVSHFSSPRRASLLWAANLTDIDIVIPEQPAWTEEDVRNFQAKEHSTISKGSALAYLGHLIALKW